MLARLARLSYHRRRRVLAVWLLLLALALTAGSSLAGSWANSARLPGSDSQRAADVLQHEYPQRSGDDVTVVFGDVPAHRARIESFLHSVALVRAVEAVQPIQLARDRQIGTATFTLNTDDDAATNRAVTRIQDLAVPLRHDGIAVEFGSDWFSSGSLPATEFAGILAAIVVLLIAFGSVLAMGLPIVTALCGIGIAVAGVGIVANFLSTPDFATQVAVMIGLGVGIDYALFIVTRYRAALARGANPEAAVVEAMTTAGRAVVFAGCTVVVSLLGMLVMGLSFLYGLAVGTSLAVAIAVAAATTLLPALLGFVGYNINRFRVGRKTHDVQHGAFARWARTVQQRPAIIAAGGLLVLVLAATPVLAMRLGVADASNDPPTSTTHKAFDLIAKGFGAGANGPILVVFDGDAAASHAQTERVVAALRDTPGVVAVNEPVVSPTRKAAIATLTPQWGPQDKHTVQLLHHLRDDVVPTAMRATSGPMHVYLGGQTAGGIDFSTMLGARLPYFIAAVLALSFVLLLIVFRSVVVPLKAVLMNMLSIAAAYGVIVAVFQWGWLGSVVGVSPAPIEAWVPMMMFAIVFGLSMDYEVFLLSAVREEYDRTGDNRTAVANGLASTARLITAAALIMVFVFGSFLVSDIRALKLIGLGLAVAVAVDATIVRIVLVPATMELLGKANWWLPEWLDRILPRVDPEGHRGAHDAIELRASERVEGDGRRDRDVERVDSGGDGDANAAVSAMDDRV
jgi:RND superfamily putative drug exporter